MSYGKKIEYLIVPEQSFAVLRSCSGCGTRTRFVNTKRFRVNANKSRLDVWLIYQCAACKHTLNLTIYERQRADQIPPEEYHKFLSNDEALAEEWGRNISFFMKNRAEIDEKSLTYHLEKLRNETLQSPQEVMILHNPYHLKIRPERLASEVLGISRSGIKKLLEAGFLELLQENHDLEIRLKEKETKHERNVYCLPCGDRSSDAGGSENYI